MHPHTKALGLALAAVLALSAVTASAAMAVTHKFHSNSNPTYLTAAAETPLSFHATAGDAKSIRCNKVNVNGTIEAEEEVEAGTFATSAVTVEPIYEECGAYNGSTKLANLTVHSAGCHYTFTGETDAEGHARVHIHPGETAGKPSCETGIQVEILGQVCIDIHPEQTVNGIHYYNEETENGTKDITIETTSTNIKSETTPHALVCPQEGGPTHETGTLTGRVRLTGFKDAAHTEPANITVSPGDTTP